MINQFVIENNDLHNNSENNQDKLKRKCNDISIFTKWAIVARYMESTNPKTNRLFQGVLDELCKIFNVSKRTIQRVVYEYKKQKADGIR